MTATTVSVIAVVISAVSLLAMLYFNSKSSKHTDVKDIERQVAERTEMNMKLDEINRNTTDIKYDVSAVKKDVQAHGDRIIKVEESVKSAHHRLDSLEKKIDEKEDKE